ncbi:MAG: hypothetical protein PHC61_13670, partial [Chitinivibrionales bacterium]|nr:hypothetical protein [Chitinivibrionales bacterium]
NGYDHLAGIAASRYGIFLDLESGMGVNGSSVKTAAGYALDIFQSLRGGAGVSYYVFKLKPNPTQENSITTRAYLNWSIPSIGIMIAPEIQVLSNEYYRNDVRFLLNAQYQFLSFWKS